MTHQEKERNILINSLVEVIFYFYMWKTIKDNTGKIRREANDSKALTSHVRYITMTHWVAGIAKVFDESKGVVSVRKIGNNLSNKSRERIWNTVKKHSGVLGRIKKYRDVSLSHISREYFIHEKEVTKARLQFKEIEALLHDFVYIMDAIDPNIPHSGLVKLTMHQGRHEGKVCLTKVLFADTMRARQKTLQQYLEITGKLKLL